MRKYTLPKSERLYLRESIGELFAKGKSFSAFPYKVVYLKSADASGEVDEALVRPEDNAAGKGENRLRQGRCAIMAVAPKKRFKHAVDRNHVKRLTREAYRLQKCPLIAALESQRMSLEVAFIYVDNKFITFDETYSIIGRAIAKIIRSL